MLEVFSKALHALRLAYLKAQCGFNIRVHFLIYHLGHQSATAVVYGALRRWLEYLGTQKKSPANKRHWTSQQLDIYAGTGDSSVENIDYR